MARPAKGCFKAILFAVGIIGLIMFISLASEIARSARGAIGLVRVEGPIYESRDIVRAIRKAAESPRIRALVVRVDSPGGAVGASEEIYRELLRLENQKPVIVSMGNVAASGGYYISLAANEILANAGTITGSIGVMGSWVEIQGLLELLRLRPIVVKSGEHKDTGSPLRPMDENERLLLQNLVFDLHRQFVREVVKSRENAIAEVLRDTPEVFDRILSTSNTKCLERAVELRAVDVEQLARETDVTTEIVERVRSLADGRVFTGEQALQLGLIDRVGTLEDARELAATYAKLPIKTPFVDLTPKKTISDIIIGSVEQVVSRLLIQSAGQEAPIVR